MTETAELGTDVDVYDPNISIVYDSDDTKAITGLPEHMRAVASKLQEWISDVQERESSSAKSMMIREEFSDIRDVFGQMRYAKKVAAADDVVSNVLEMAEGLALQGVKWTSPDPDKADVFNQMAAEMDLDSLVRKVWREEDTISQVVLATWWETGTFSIRGETENGNARKATKTVTYPRRVTVLDSAKVMPVGSLHFGMERLAWIPTPVEAQAYRAHLASQSTDPVMDRFYVGFYTPTPAELAELKGTDGNSGLAGILGIKDVKELILLNEQYVTRHTLTRSDYERWAPVRLASVFPLIDMKRHLMTADRVSLIGAANYILLVKKGDKDAPAHQAEIDNLKEGFKMLAKIPVIFSDHRLSIEIVTPSQDYTLQSEKYNLIDQRILQKMVNAIPYVRTTGSDGGGGTGLGRWTARALETRRHQQKRYLERLLARMVMSHPDNAGVFKDDKPPSLAHFPANIMLDSDAQLAQQIISARTMREISRETLLEYFGFDQAIEAMRMAFEEKHYDDIFKTVVPFSSTGGAPPAAQGGAGAGGGRPAGGGTPSKNPQKTQVTDSGNTSSKGAK